MSSSADQAHPRAGPRYRPTGCPDEDLPTGGTHAADAPASSSSARPPKVFAALPTVGVAERTGVEAGRSSKGVRVVAFGGGTGMAALLSGLRNYTENITAVVTVTDNGGSSGRLRNDFDIVAPGDIRNCLMALADVDPLIQDVFQYRFTEAEFKGHSFGNLFITVLTKVCGDFSDSIRELNRLLCVRGQVVPAAGNKVSLVAHHPDGTKSTGEVEISQSRKPIERIELRPSPVPMSPEIRRAIDAAEVFLFGPGSLFTSVIPNLLLEGLTEAIQENGSPRVYIGNIMTQPGETDGYCLSDHLRAIRRHVGPDFPDCVLAHKGPLPDDLVEKYRVGGAVPVAPGLLGEEFSSVRLIERDFFSGSTTVRHDSARLAQVIQEEILVPLERQAQVGDTARSSAAVSSPLDPPKGTDVSSAAEEAIARSSSVALPDV